MLAKLIRTKMKCLCCRKETDNPKYCDNQCQANLVKQKKIENIKQGIAVDRRTVKNYLISERGTKCGICDIREWQGEPIPLILDHIDGNSDNWNLSNLRLVCSNCDSLLPTYKSKNRGKGRYYRRLRYSEGKSY